MYTRIMYLFTIFYTYVNFFGNFTYESVMITIIIIAAKPVKTP